MGRRLRKAKYKLGQQARIHDRTLTTLPLNAKIAVDVVDDAYGIPEDPTYDARRGELVAPGQARVTVVRSIRTDPLGALKAQGSISECQYLAGQMWSWSYMRSELGSVRSVDLSRTKVDGGKIPEPLTETVKKALAQLRRARDALGEDGELLVIDILGRGLTLARAADKRGLGSKSGGEYVGRQFRECLDRLSVVFGCATPAPVLERA